MRLDFLDIASESNKISMAASWSSRVQGGRKTPVALLLALPAPNPYKHWRLPDELPQRGGWGQEKQQQVQDRSSQ